MALYAMLGRYGSGSLQQASADRTKKAQELVKQRGGTIQAIYGLLGKHDLLVLADFPGIEEAMVASIALTKQIGIEFQTFLAVPVERFDQLLKQA
jgi:uncharacterized protein with GYD domain